MNIVLFGCPNSGKGSLSQKLIECSFVHISTGDLLREEVKTNGRYAHIIKYALDNGKFVDDTVVFDILKKHLELIPNNTNLLFDGIPRTFNQCITLENIINVDFAFELVCPKNIIFDRAKNRLVCDKCKRTTSKLVENGFCSVCGGNLVSRLDDDIDLLNNRMLDYDLKTEPIRNYYISKGIYHQVDASVSVDFTLKQVKRVLNYGNN